MFHIETVLHFISPYKSTTDYRTMCFILSWTDQVMQYAPLNVERYTQPRLTGYPETAYPLMQLYAKLP